MTKRPREAGFSILLFALLAGLAGSSVAQGVQTQAAAPQRASQLIDLASKTHGVSADRLSIGSRAIQKHPLTGVTVEVAKVVDAKTGEAYLVALDAAGRPIDAAKATEAEAAARAARYGKLDQKLAERLAGMGPSANALPVSIWVKHDTTLPARPNLSVASAEAADVFVQARVAELKRVTAGGRRPVVDELVRMGVQPQEADLSPVVFAELTPGQISKIEKHPDVVALYGQAEYTLFADKAATTQRAYNVWAVGNVGRNAAARIVVHEPDGVSDANPYLNNLDHPVMYWCPRSWAGTDCSIGKNIGAHATEVAGVMASTHPLYRGVAPGAPLILSANSQEFIDAKLIRAAEWGIASGGAVTNMSWGTICGGTQDLQSRWVDWATANLFHTFVIAAGNHPAGCANATNDEKVASPALAWSVIAVGSENDNNTGFWTGDTMSTFSDWRNPDFATGMQKPEVTAVGENVMTTDNAGGDWLTPAPGVNGTSFASPMVAGQVALLVARQPGQMFWPETNKAAVLVSAFHDIEATQDRDGVGAVVMYISDDAYRFGRFRNGFMDSTSADPAVFANVISATAGNIVRVAMAYDSVSNGSTTDAIGADIDLRVKRSDTGAVVCSSASVQNAWEQCSFTAPVTGTYTIEVDRFSFTTGWPGTYYGVAWGFQGKSNFCSGALTLTVPAGGVNVAVNTANGSTFFDSYPGYAVSLTGREKVHRLNLTSTRNIVVTDNNANLDLCVLQIANCAADPFTPTVRACGQNSVTVPGAPAGTYYIVVDGRSGAVGTTTMNVQVQ